MDQTVREQQDALELAAGLQALHRRIAGRFGRREPLHRALAWPEGVAGAGTAATFLIASKSKPDRLHSKVISDALAGLIRYPIASGKTNRHRLNYGGERQGNAAPFRIVVDGLRCDLRTKACMRRCAGGGMNKIEVSH